MTIVNRTQRRSGASETTESPPTGIASWRTCRATCTRRCGTSPQRRGQAAPAPGKGFKRVASVLQDDKWLAKQIELILASGGSASPGGTAPSAPALSTGVPAAHKGRARGGAAGATAGFVVSADSMADLDNWPSLTTSQLRHRRNLRSSLGLVPFGRCLHLTRDALFESPSQAAAVMIGHSANGPVQWIAPRRPLLQHGPLGPGDVPLAVYFRV